MTKGSQTRERIVRAAVRAFGKTGFFDARLDAIAAAAGVQRPAIINYFGSKLGLYRECVGFVMAEVGRAFVARQTGRETALERLDLQFELNLEMGLERLDHAKLIVLLYYGASIDPELRKVYRETLAGIRERYAGILHAAVRERALAADRDVPALAALVHEAIMGMMINFVAQDRKTELPTMRRKWALLKRRLLGVSP